MLVFGGNGTGVIEFRESEALLRKSKTFLRSGSLKLKQCARNGVGRLAIGELQVID